MDSHFEGVLLPSEWGLYDLNSDPKELTNLIEEPAYQDIVKELRQDVGLVMDYKRSLDLLPRSGPGGTSLSDNDS